MKATFLLAIPLLLLLPMKAFSTTEIWQPVGRVSISTLGVMKISGDIISWEKAGRFETIKVERLEGVRIFELERPLQFCGKFLRIGPKWHGLLEFSVYRTRDEIKLDSTSQTFTKGCIAGNYTN